MWTQIEGLMRADLKGIFSLQQPNLRLEEWKPSHKKFGIKLMLFVGTEENSKSDAFDILLCSPKWFVEQPLQQSFLHGERILFTENYDYKSLLSHLQKRCGETCGSTWDEIAMQIDRWAAWEFKYLRSNMAQKS